MAGRSPTAGWRVLERLRFQSHSGRVIRRHRALQRIDFQRASIVHPVLLLLAAYAALAFGIDLITDFWTATFAFWLPHLALPTLLEARSGTLLNLLPYTVAAPAFDGRQPDFAAARISLVACVVAMSLAVAVLRRAALPIGYLVWAASLIQLVATASFWLVPGAFTHTITSHVGSGLEFALILLVFTPMLLAFSYYVFDYPLAHKLCGSVVILGGIILVTPYQYLMHVVLIDSASIIVMPVIYVLFGYLFSIAVFIALYAYAMSWDL